MKGKKGQSIFTVLIIMIMLGLFYFIGFAGTVAQYGAQLVQENGITGLEALFWSNVNLVVLVVYGIALLGVGRFGL